MKILEQIKTFKIKGKTKSETLENLSLVVLFISIVMLWFGLMLGSFIKYTFLLATFGAFLLLPGICIFIASKLIEDYEEEKTSLVQDSASSGEKSG